MKTQLFLQTFYYFNYLRWTAAEILLHPGWSMAWWPQAMRSWQSTMVRRTAHWPWQHREILLWPAKKKWKRSWAAPGRGCSGKSLISFSTEKRTFLEHKSYLIIIMKTQRFCFVADCGNWISNCSDFVLGFERRRPDSPSRRERAFPGHPCPWTAVYKT